MGPCKEKGCTVKRATYNTKGQSVGKYCYKHAKMIDKNMINVYKKICDYPGCKVGARFKTKGSKPTKCLKHADENMIDTKKIKKCIFDKCHTTPSYGTIEDGKAKYCSKHFPGKKGDRIDYKSYKCKTIIDGKKCMNNAQFNYPDKKGRPIACEIHKLCEFVNIVHKRICTSDNCSTTASFGLIGFLPDKCAQHKDKFHVKNPRKRCIKKNCHSLAIYGIKMIRKHCEIHKKKTEINISERKCSECKFLEILNSINLCENCGVWKSKSNRLIKQNIIKDFLIAENIVFISCDKIIDGGACVRSRPDFLFDCHTHYVILEVDENQHHDRNPECEIIRMKNISQALGLRTIFLRYNPDIYKIDDIKYDTSSNKRHKLLKKQLLHLISLSKTPEDLRKYGFLSAIYLYFDEFDKKNVNPTVITEFEDKQTEDITVGIDNIKLE